MTVPTPKSRAPAQHLVIRPGSHSLPSNSVFSRLSKSHLAPSCIIQTDPFTSPANPRPSMATNDAPGANGGGRNHPNLPQGPLPAQNSSPPEPCKITPGVSTLWRAFGVFPDPLTPPAPSQCTTPMKRGIGAAPRARTSPQRRQLRIGAFRPSPPRSARIETVALGTEGPAAAAASAGQVGVAGGAEGGRRGVGGRVATPDADDASLHHLLAPKSVIVV